MTARMFGVIVAGRLVQTDFEPVDDSRFLINIPDADNINHIVVFLTGAQPFPDGMGGSIYFSWPESATPACWQLLGFISNSKPSAIFKISKPRAETEVVNPFGLQQMPHVAHLGVSVEPLNQLEMQTPVISKPSNLDSMRQFVNKMLESCFNYVSSFSVTSSQIVPSSTETYVPLNTLQQWYLNFQRRLQQDPNFWKI